MGIAQACYLACLEVDVVAGAQSSAGRTAAEAPFSHLAHLHRRMAKMPHARVALPRLSLRRPGLAIPQSTACEMLHSVSLRGVALEAGVDWDRFDCASQ